MSIAEQDPDLRPFFQMVLLLEVKVEWGLLDIYQCFPYSQWPPHVSRQIPAVVFFQ